MTTVQTSYTLNMQPASGLITPAIDPVLGGFTYSISDASPVSAMIVSTVVRAADLRYVQNAVYSIVLTNPAGAGPITVATLARWRDSGGNIIPPSAGSPNTELTTTAAEISAALPPRPAGAADCLFGLVLRSAGTNRKVNVKRPRVVSTATPTEIVGVALERDLRRAAIDVNDTAEALITAGTPGMLAGQLTYLCDTLPAVLELDGLYCNTTPVVIAEPGHPLDGLTHRAIGRTRITAERALNGLASRWLYVTDFREVA